MTAWSSLFYPFPSLPASLHCSVSAPGLHQIRLFDADVTQLMGELSNKYQPGVKSINPESKDCILFYFYFNQCREDFGFGVSDVERRTRAGDNIKSF